jgi:hypothetical protein
MYVLTLEGGGIRGMLSFGYLDRLKRFVARVYPKKRISQ